MYFELESRTWRQHFWLFILASNCFKKTQLYQHEVPEQRSGVQKVAQFKHWL